MSAVFRPYSASDALRSDRSAGDRLRHRQKIREALKENIAEIVAEEAILTRGSDRIVKVPIRGIKEYRFVFGEGSPRVASSGDGEVQKGQVIGQDQQDGQPGNGPGPGGDRPGVDYYETDVTIDELVDLLFEDLQLPDMERKRLREIEVDHGTKRLGYRRSGIRVHLDKKRTLKSKIRRKVATGPRESRPDVAGETTARLKDRTGGAASEEQRFPFHKEDLRYRRRVPDVRPESNAVVVCIMDTSGSMDVMKKYLARSFFFLLYQFVRTRYQTTELVFVAHHTQAREVGEEEFFSKGESGGTIISSGYRKALEIIQDRYHPSLWNVYAFHCSDGENFSSDNTEAFNAAKELCDVCNLFGYGEIKSDAEYFGATSMRKIFERLDAENFHAVVIDDREDVWPSLKAVLSKERTDPQQEAVD
ncbi:YeaH/YhbH family protein [Denitrobaculum tricleocarpae]|uniref:DUF444 family protein n=1 Tax=Denitrobaculum tricleocarpae TaxID=2591009 RepID=A0A545TY80_9PROT|nr:DUF444 family protein [Denitrobaculum tricleocarpae]TQV82144.1 DUF444 family protein [Denitrobaculum tricleocarpae]